MPEEITKFDPNALRDRLRERIQGVLSDLVPQAAWDSLVQTELDRFFKPVVSGMGYWERKDPSDFQKICNAVIHDVVMERLKAQLGTADWKAKIDAQLDVPERLLSIVQTALYDQVREALQVSVASVIDQTLQNLLYRINTTRST